MRLTAFTCACLAMGAALGPGPAAAAAPERCAQGAATAPREAVIAPAASAAAQEAGGRPSHAVSFALPPGQRVFSLGKTFVLEGSLSVAVDGAELRIGRDYLVDHTSGTVLLRKSFPDGAIVKAAFEFLPLGLQEAYGAPVVIEKRGGAGWGGGAARGVLAAEGGRGATAGGAEGTGKSVPPASLVVGGSKRLAFEFGTGRDLAMSQSLDLDITGKVGRDVEVRAVLSDRNLPVLPEGDTQTLEELDEVFVRVTSPSLRATFGDYTLTGPPSEFGRFSRSVEGVEGSAVRGDEEIRVATATPRGRFKSVEFFGEEGKQGAYYVAGQGGGGATIVPGSEKVWLDGELMRRGTAADYTVDYAGAAITFTSGRPVTKDSRITVDYEYSYEDYRRSLYSAIGRTVTGPVALTASYAVERDDRNSAVGGDLTEADRSKLRDIGDSFADGALPDTSGLSGEEPGLVRPPSSHEVVDLAVAYSPWRALSLETEVALSDLDLNTFSGLDDSDNKGTAYSARANLSPYPLSALGLNLGSLQMSASLRSTQSSFASMGRTSPAMDYYKWNLAPEGLGPGERRSELSLTYRPLGPIAVGADVGHIAVGDGGSSRVVSLSSSAAGRRGYDVRWERAESEAVGSRMPASRRDRGLARMRWAFGPVAPTFEVETERRRDDLDGGEAGGADYTQVGGELKGARRGVAASASLYVRDDFALSRGERHRESSGITQSYGLSYRRGSKLGLDGRYGLRTLSVDSTGARVNTYVAHFDGVGGGLKGALGWRGTYEVTSTDEGPRTTTFVGPGKGHYDSDGRYVGIGDYDLVVAGDGSPLASRVTFNLSSDLDWGRTQRSDSQGPLQKLAAALQWSGLYRLEEHTRAAIAAPSLILRPGSYMNPDALIRGTSVLRQDLEILPRGAVLTPRIRYEVRTRLQNVGGDGVSGTRLRLISVRLRSRALSRTTLEAEQSWGLSSAQGSSTDAGAAGRETSETTASVVVRPNTLVNLSLRSSYFTDRSADSGGGTRWELEPSARLSKAGAASFEASCKWAQADRGESGSYDQLLGWLGDRVEYSLSGQVGLGGGLTLTGTLRATGIKWRDLSHYMRMEMRALF